MVFWYPSYGLVLFLSLVGCVVGLACPNTLPQQGPLQGFIECSELVNAQGDADVLSGTDSSQSQLRSVWADEHSSFFFAHDLPIFVSRLPKSLISRVGSWNEWIRNMEPEWRERNGGITQVSYEGSKDAYNIFREANESSHADIGPFGQELFNFIEERFLTLQRVFKTVLGMPQTSAARTAFSKALSDNICDVRLDLCQQQSFVQLYAWCNVFYPQGPTARESFIGKWHGHQWPWHGYAILNGTDTQTGFFSPFTKSVFVLRHADNHIVMLPGGLKHAALHPGSKVDPRITMAFDIRYGTELLKHGVGFLNNRHLKDMHDWDFQVLYDELKSMKPDTTITWGGSLQYAPHVGASMETAKQSEL